MKIRAMLGGLCLLLILQFAGCDRVTPSVPNSAETGSSHELRVAPEDRNQGFMLQSFVETPEGYFYGRNSSLDFGNLIYFCPRGESAFYPLCGKPNCSHQGRDCNAYYEGVSFGYYNGALYTIGYAPDNCMIEQVIKINPDGTDHTVVAEFDTSNMASFRPVFHHGKLYLLGSSDTSLPLEEQEDRLIVLNLADGSQTEPASEALRETFLPEFYSFYGNKLYGFGAPDKSQNYLAKDLHLVELDATTGTLRFLTPTYTNSLYVTDSTLYYLEADWKTVTEAAGKSMGDSPDETKAFRDSFFEGFTQPEIGFREYDLASRTVKNCGTPVKNPCQAIYDEDYIYLFTLPEEGREGLTLYFLSRAYELLDQIDLPAGLGIGAVTSDRIFFFSSDSDSKISQSITHYLDRSRIGSHQLELMPVENY